MSIRVMAWSWQQSVKSTDKLVLLALADHSDDQGKCWPGMTGIANKCGLNRRTVVNSIKRLEDAGLLTNMRRTGKHSQNVYYLAVKGCESNSLVNEIPHGSESDDIEVVNDVHTKHHKRQPSKKRQQKTTIPDGFSLTDDLITYGASLGIRNRKTLERYTEDFIDQCQGKGYAYCDFKSVWRKWLRQAIADGKVKRDPATSEVDY